MKGQCLCRRVSVAVAAPPSHVTICNCTFCRRLGAAWGYYQPAEVTISGETKAYRRDDIAEVWLDAHFCPHCGTTTHYEVIRESHEGIAVNTRLFDQNELTGIETRFLDGRSVESEEDEFTRTAIGHIGDGRAF